MASIDKEGQDEQKQGRFPMTTIRERAFHSLDADDINEKATNAVKAIGALIVFSVGLAVFATEPVVRSSQGDLLGTLDIAVASILPGFGLHH